MPLPVGFKVNGSKIKKAENVPLPPRVKKIIALLDQLPSAEVLTSQELAERLGLSILSGGAIQSSALHEYREKVDNKLFWGSRANIADLRKQLSSPEEPHGKN